MSILAEYPDVIICSQEEMMFTRYLLQTHC